MATHAARAFAFAALAALAVEPLTAQVQPVVATSPVPLNSTVTGGPVVTDSCGNLYEYGQDGSTGIIRIAAGTGKVTTIVKNTQGYASGPGLAMSGDKKNLYFPDFSNYYTNHFDQVPIVNCQPGTINNNFPSDLGSLGVYYIGSIGSGGGDAKGDLFFVTSQGYTNDIFEEVYTAATSTYQSAYVLQNWANQILYVASDAAGNLYFADKTSSSGANNIYLLKAGYTAAPVLFASGFNHIVGLSFDPAGNLYVTDSGSGSTPGVSAIYEIPVVSGALVAADRYAIAELPLVNMVAVDANKNIYVANYTSGAFTLKTGSAVAPAAAIGSTSNAIINYVFNAATTPTAISAVTGTATSPTFSIATGGCATGTTYSALVPAVTPPTTLPATSCTVTATYTPSAVGEQTGGVLFSSASGTVTTYVAGIGNGAAVTIDPGNVAPTVTTFTAPYGVTVDNVGNVFVTDSRANTLTEFPAGSGGTGTTVSTGTSLTLSGPTGVAVDNLGDIFVADTGNSRVLEIPVVAGKLTPANTFVLSLTVKNPQGVATDGAGNLYVADTGDHTVQFVPNVNAALVPALAISYGTGLKAPSGVTVDVNGNVYVSDSDPTVDGVFEFPAPFGTGQAEVAVGLNTPTSVATDAAGSLFVVNSGAGSILRYPNNGGILGAQEQVGSTVVAPTSVATDAYGNLFVTDTTDAVVAEIQRLAGTLAFGSWNVGTLSTALSETVSSTGNQPAIFSTPSYTTSGATTAGFAVSHDGCAGASLAPGTSCALTATFTPTAPELNAQENLTLASNAKNGASVIGLLGTGAHITPTTVSLVLTSPAGNPATLNAHQAVSFTATVNTGSNTAVPSGTIKFSVNGSAVSAAIKIVNNAASLSLPNGLPQGTAVVISAAYSGDPINYSGSTGSLTEDVVPLSDTLALAIPLQYTSPNSIGENDEVAYTIGSIARSASGVVTATLAAPTALVAGTVVTVANVTDSSYNGTFLLTGASGSTLTWKQAGSVGSSSSGTATGLVQNANPGVGPLTATLVPSSTVIPGGTVTFYAGTQVLGTAPVQNLPTGYVAQLTSASLPAATSNAQVEDGSYSTLYSLTAVYSGDTTYAAATSAPQTVTVVAPPAVLQSCAPITPSGTTTGTGATATCGQNTTGAYYTLTPANPTITVTSSTATGPSSGSTTLTINSYGGWNGILNFTCSGLPAYATCAPFPGYPNGVPSTPGKPVTPATVDFIINTNVTPIVPTGTGSMVWWMAGGTGLMLLVLRRRIQKLGHLRAGQLLTVLGAALLLGGSAAGMSGCSSQAYGFITPAGTSTVTVKVSAAQVIPTSTAGSTYLPDPNPTTFQITLVVK
jgi:sugar lactone lactonase YvrE